MAEGTVAEVLAGEARFALAHGSMLDVLPTLPENSIDSSATDPPYELNFMARRWDRSGIAFRQETWAAVFRVLKPGGYLLAFGGTRTVHRLACAIEDAGFEIRDMISWVQGQGFPKSLNLNKELHGVCCECEGSQGAVQVLQHDLRSVRGANVSAGEPVEDQPGEVLYPVMPQQGAQEIRSTRPEPETNEREKSGLERRGDVLSETRELQADQVRALPGGVPLDGKEGRVCDGAPSDHGADGGPPAAARRGRSPRRSRSPKQQPDEPRTVAEQPEPQATRAWPTCGGCGKPIVPSGIGTALKPACEPIIVARKPIEKGLTAAQNFLKWGTGALNIDACRVNPGDPVPGGGNGKAHNGGRFGALETRGHRPLVSPHSSGRWPPNLLLTHDARCRRIGSREVKANPTWDTPNRECKPTFTGEVVSEVRHGNGAVEAVPVFECHPSCPVHELDVQTGELGLSAGTQRTTSKGWLGTRDKPGDGPIGFGDSGTASRFFPQFEWDPELDDLDRFRYVAKTARAERDQGLVHFRPFTAAEATNSEDGQARLNSPRTGAGRTGGARNPHPTVKPAELMRWLVRLVTPPGGVCLDPFMGSGSTGMACGLEGLRFVGCDLNDSDEEPFVSIARARITYVFGGLYVPRESLRAPKPPVQMALFERVGS